MEISSLAKGYKPDYEKLNIPDMREGHENELVPYPQDDRDDGGLWLATYTARKQLSLSGNLKRAYFCLKCKNRGFTPVIREYFGEWRIEHLKCECMTNQHIEDTRRQSGMPEEYWNQTSKDYFVSQPFQSVCLKKAGKYVKEESATNTWFIMLGQSGAGKTKLCQLIFGTLIKQDYNYPQYVVWSNFISELKRLASGTELDKHDASYMLQNIKDYDLLFLDECLKTYNDTDIKYFNEIINSRYTNKKKTILVSERLLDEYKKIDTSVYGRMIEMTKQGDYILQINKDDSKNMRVKDFNGEML